MYFHVNVNWGSFVGRPLRRVQMYVRALLDFASKVNSPRGNAIHRKRSILKYASSPHLNEQVAVAVDGRMRGRGQKMDGGAMTLVGLPDAKYGGPSKERGGAPRVSHWTDVVISLGSASHLAADLKVHPQVCEK